MATDNKGVMVYLPRDVEEVLEKYCTENNITRKNKDGEPVPSMGTGIVQYLKSHLLGIAPSNMVGTVLTKDDVLELIRESITGDGLTPEEARAIAESAIEQALVPIREQLSNARVGTHTDLTPDGVQTAIDAAIEKAIAPISIDLAELLDQVDKLRGSIDGKSQSKSRTSATTTEDPHPEVIKLANRLKADPDGLQMSVRAGIAEGLGGKALCEFLFEHGHGANNGSKPFDPSVAGRFVKAIAYLDEK
jgi:hypothetical protein